MPHSYPADAKVSRKVAWRLIPFMGVLYLLAFLDRVNVGFTELSMNSDLKLSATVFGTGAGVFFVGYVLFGVPSNLVLHPAPNPFTLDW
jgi:ACS family tartrate transporter-like MFS transporter